MAWRVHLTNQAIGQVDILPGSKFTTLAAWTQRDRAVYFDLESGAELGEHVYRAAGFDNRQGELWRQYLATLVAPNGAYLPFARTAQAAIYTSEDGRLRLYQMGREQFLLELEGKELPLEVKVPLMAVGLDRFLGVIAAMDEKSKLHLYQQHIRVGVFDLGLKPGEDYTPNVAIANGGAAIFATNGREIVLSDSSGKARKRASVHYFIGRMACSPDGRLLATSDLETGVIRAYNGDDLTPTHQRHAIDLLQDAAQLQLIADLPPFSIAPGALAINNAGAVAFAMAGVVCATELKYMDALPRLQALL
jgi:hypothetical protein